MLNIPIPTMFFHETNNGGLEVVDGKQRLTSIWSFIQGRFPDGSSFKLKGLDVFAEPTRLLSISYAVFCLKKKKQNKKKTKKQQQQKQHVHNT